MKYKSKQTRLQLIIASLIFIGTLGIAYVTDILMENQTAPRKPSSITYDAQPKSINPESHNSSLDINIKATNLALTHFTFGNSTRSPNGYFHAIKP